MGLGNYAVRKWQGQQDRPHRGRTVGISRMRGLFIRISSSVSSAVSASPSPSALTIASDHTQLAANERGGTVVGEVTDAVV